MIEGEKKDKFYKSCPYICGILYSIFAALAVLNYIEAFLHQVGPFVWYPQNTVSLVICIFFAVLFLLTVVFNVWVFTKTRRTLANILFEVLFPLLTWFGFFCLFTIILPWRGFENWIVGLFS